MSIRTTIAATAVLAGFAPALAADLPSRSAPPPAPAIVPAFSWTGFYVGAHAGYAWGESSSRTALGGTWSSEGEAFRNNWIGVSNGKLSPAGFAGGLHLGANYQMNQFVLGIEADVSYVGLKKRSANVGVPLSIAPGLNYAFSRSIETDWVFTLRPRAGLAFDRTLVYLTGGLAVGNVDGAWSVVGSNGYMKTGSASKSRTGYVLGAGVEHAFMNNLTARLEYLYTDLGKVSYNSTYVAGSTFGPPANYTEHQRQSLKFHTVRLGVSYKF
jgi:outer membrane immunogenic protein